MCCSTQQGLREAELHSHSPNTLSGSVSQGLTDSEMALTEKRNLLPSLAKQEIDLVFSITKEFINFFKDAKMWWVYRYKFLVTLLPFARKQLLMQLPHNPGPHLFSVTAVPSMAHHTIFDTSVSLGGSHLSRCATS